MIPILGGTSPPTPLQGITPSLLGKMGISSLLWKGVKNYIATSIGHNKDAELWYVNYLLKGWIMHCLYR